MLVLTLALMAVDKQQFVGELISMFSSLHFYFRLKDCWALIRMRNM